MTVVFDAKWKIQKQDFINDFYDYARPALYTSKEVATILSLKYVCISKEKIEEACRKYRQNRYTGLEDIVTELLKLS